MIDDRDYIQACWEVRIDAMRSNYGIAPDQIIMHVRFHDDMMNKTGTYNYSSIFDNKFKNMWGMSIIRTSDIEEQLPICTYLPRLKDIAFKH